MYRSVNELVKNNLLVKHVAGSHAYGTSRPASDTDFRGIFCADPINIRTPFFPVYETIDSNEEDTKYYELTHFMKLCLECNPNIIETLWVNLSDVLVNTSVYELLREHRHEFLSSKVAFTFSGYAIAQLKRLKGHKKWIMKPQPIESPKPYQFLSVVQWFTDNPSFLFHYQHNHRLIPYSNHLFGVYKWDGYDLWDRYGNINQRFDENRCNLGTPLMFVQWNEEEYKQAKNTHEQYHTWKKNRNKERGEMEEEFGYDGKHAMHLVRLMRMGIEALRDEEIIVKRPDAEELLEIRNGAWTYEHLIEYAEHMDHEVRNVWYKKTKLRKTPDLHLAAKVLMDAQNMMWD